MYTCIQSPYFWIIQIINFRDDDCLNKNTDVQKSAGVTQWGGGAEGQAALNSGRFKGRRISVWWPFEACWYTGLAFKFENGRWFVGFDEDGDEADYDLNKEQWKLVRLLM